MQYITITDYILLPFYLFVVLVLALHFRNKYYKNKHPLRKYFMWAFGLKLFGGLFVSLIYSYYYKGGDTLAYWYQTEIINSSLQDSFTSWVKLISGTADRYDVDIYNYTTKFYWYGIDSPEYLISIIGAIIGVFTFTTYLPTTLLLAAISFIGIWKMFVVFTKLYPKLINQMALSFLFIPSVVFWGSGFMKDTITISCIGWVVHFFYLIFYENKKLLLNSIGDLFFLNVIFIIKSYIVMAFLPAALLWGVGLLSYKIKNKRLIVVARYFLYITAIVGLVFIGGRVQNELFGGYNLETVASTSYSTRSYLLRVSMEQDGSGYDLGDMDPTLLGMIEKAPAGINVTLFRPYPWEARKPIVMISALEALFFLIFTLAVLFRNNPLKVLYRILADETLQFCLIFTLVFAFAVGISTSNFGSLSRYKIPCMPFYTAFLFIIFNPPKEAIVLKMKKVKSKLVVG